jgi:Phage integrase family
MSTIAMNVGRLALIMGQPATKFCIHCGRESPDISATLARKVWLLQFCNFCGEHNCARPSRRFLALPHPGASAEELLRSPLVSCSEFACGFALANKGHDTRALQAYLDHRNIQHTVRYTELSPHWFKDFWR